MTHHRNFPAIAFVASAFTATLIGCAPHRFGGIEVAPTGGAGFAGLRNYELLQQPAYSPPTDCPANKTCALVPVPDSLDLVPNHHYDWRPALSTGVTFQAFSTKGQQIGGGFGANVVLLPDASGKTAPWPAITAHFGTRENGFFAGLILSPTDAISIPGGAPSIRVQRDKIPDLTLKNRARAGHLYIGIRLGGKNQSLNPVAKVDVATVDTLTAGDKKQITYTLTDASNNELTNRECAFSTNPDSVASISSKGELTAKVAGQTVVTVKCEGVSGARTVVVKKKNDAATPSRPESRP